MNGCKDVTLSFIPNGYFGNNNCNIVESSYSYYMSKGSVNISNLNFDVIQHPQANTSFIICKYDKSNNFINRTSYRIRDFSLGSHSLALDSNFVYKISYPFNYVSNFKAYQCDIGVGSMANELAFGKLTFLDEINTIIPFVIPLIAFALGFLLLKKMIKRGNKGHA